MNVDVRTDEWEVAVARAAVHELLMRAFAFPTRAHRKALRTNVAPVVAGLSTGDPAVDDPLQRLLTALAIPLDELRAAHSEVFTHIEPVDCPPYESAYVPADVFRQTEVMADVAGFYRAHGLRVGGTDRERPDHIVTELDFVGFMARKEAYALAHLGSDAVDECRRTRDLFVRDHLGCWGPGFGRRVALVARHPAMRTAGELLAAWLDADLAALEIVPVARLDEPAPRLEPDDDDACGFDGCGLAGSTSTVPVELRLGPRGAR